METINKSFSIEWLEPNRAFLITVHAGQLRPEDVAAIQADTSIRYRTASQKLHSVIDLRNLEYPAEGGLEGSLGSIGPVSRENRGETIIVVSADSPLVEFTTGATMKGLQLPFRLCRNMDEVLAILDSIDDGQEDDGQEDDGQEDPTKPSLLPYSIDWYISNRVLLITVLGTISGEELHQMASEAFSRIRKAPSVVNAIVDLRGLNVRPQNLQTALTDAGQFHHRNQGTSVIVTTPMHPVVKFICTAVMTALRLKFELCDSFDEARDRISELEAKRSGRV